MDDDSRYRSRVAPTWPGRRDRRYWRGAGLRIERRAGLRCPGGDDRPRQGALRGLGLVVAVVYMFSSEGTVFGEALLIALLNALVLYLLLGREGARNFFGLGAGASP